MDDAQLQILQTFEQACLNLQQPGREKDAEKVFVVSFSSNAFISLFWNFESCQMLYHYVESY